jgi:hypothetical protein
VCSSNQCTADPYKACVDRINYYHTMSGAPALTLRASEDSCVDSQAAQDLASGVPHHAFGQCGESGQCECPGWSGDPATTIIACIDAMWAAGPGEGHHDMIASTAYTSVACGFAMVNGSLTLTQDYYR